MVHTARMYCACGAFGACGAIVDGLGREAYTEQGARAAVYEVYGHMEHARLTLLFLPVCIRCGCETAIISRRLSARNFAAFVPPFTSFNHHTTGRTHS